MTASPAASRTATKVAIEVEDLAVEFAGEEGWVRVVDGVSFHVDRGETLAVVGESGSGKSVTNLAIMGLIPRPGGRVAGGRVVVDGIDMLSLKRSELEDVRGNRIAMIFQEPMTSLNPAMRVGDQIAEVVRRHRGASRTDARARAIEVLDMVGIPKPKERVRSFPHEFSGGMRQRAMIAMAVACDPAVLIADEPTTALDVTIQAQVLTLLREMRDELGMALVFITHDLAVVADIAERVMVMYAGQAVETAEVHDLFARPRHPYTEGLLRSMPQVGSRGQRLSSIPGQPPQPARFPPGCRFSPRCPYAVEACSPAGAPPPPLFDLGGGRSARCIRTDELVLRGTR